MKMNRVNTPSVFPLIKGENFFKWLEKTSTSLPSSGGDRGLGELAQNKKL